VHIERERGVRADGCHHQRPNGEIRHEVPVHDIYVNVIGTCLGGFDDLLAQPTEVGGEYRRCELDLIFH